MILQCASLSEPEVVREYQFETGITRTVAEPMLAKSYPSDDYTSERTWFTARDGTRVPVSLVYRNDTNLGDNPAYIQAYGAYGFASEPRFDPAVISLLDRGYVYAVIHVRGGGELGAQWHNQGRLFNKLNSANDFIDGTRYLTENGFAHPNKVFAKGVSAGGLVIGIVANEAPELYQGIVARVPFVDVLTTMSDNNAPMTSGEYLEWGNPDDPRVYDYMLSYSPYDQIRPQAYPTMFITAAMNDRRVLFHEPLKWMAKLRKYNTGSGRLVIDIAGNTGHRGPSDQFERRRMDALELAFIIDTLSR